MPRKPTSNQINYRANQFLLCKNSSDIEYLLKLSHFTFAQHILSPEYHYFKIPKSKGGFREIEAPALELKKIQRKLNEYLQYVYFLNQSQSAYGFIMSTAKENRKNTAKNIVSNAKQHLGNPYLLNIDFDDYFHQISTQEVYTIFKKPPFNFTKNQANTLAKICTNKGRLPMGAPTSPVLSNFACLALDKELELWATKHKITYTRFVDDLSFSSKNRITPQHFKQILQITSKYEFVIDPAKTKWYDAKQTKIVTGLVIGKQIELQKDYLTELTKDIDRLQKATEVAIITGNIHKPTATKKYKQEIMGKINFIAVVKGYNSEQYEHFMMLYEQAINPPNKEQLSLRWTDFSNYTNF